MAKRGGKTIGTLAVKLIANSRGFTRELKKANRSIGGFTRTVGFMKKAMVGIGVGLGIRRFTSFISDAVDRLDALGKTASKLGLPTAKLRALQYAAQLSGVEIRTFNMGMQRMVRRVAEAAKGLGEGQQAIKDLGLDAEKLVQLTPDEMFLRFADAMQKVRNRSEQVRLTFKLVDSEGVQMVNMFRLGAERLREMEIAAVRLGIALGDDVVGSVEKAKDAMRIAGARWEGAVNQLVVALTPAIEKLPVLIDAVTVATKEYYDSLDKGESPIWASVDAYGAFLGVFRKASQAIKTDYDALARQREKDRVEAARLTAMAQKEEQRRKEIESWNKRLSRALRELETPAERYNAKLNELFDLYDRGLLKGDKFAEMLRRLRKRYEDILKIPKTADDEVMKKLQSRDYGARNLFAPAVMAGSAEAQRAQIASRFAVNDPTVREIKDTKRKLTKALVDVNRSTQDVASAVREANRKIVVSI